jgi:hypothetical protein
MRSAVQWNFVPVQMSLSSLSHRLGAPRKVFHLFRMSKQQHSHLTIKEDKPRCSTQGGFRHAAILLGSKFSYETGSRSLSLWSLRSEVN